MSNPSFWVIPRRLNLICRRIKFRRREINPKKLYKIPNTMKVLKEEYVY